jgi:hypothetical protein
MKEFFPLRPEQMNELRMKYHHPLLFAALTILKEEEERNIIGYKARHPTTIAALNKRLFRQGRIAPQKISIEKE